MSYDSLFERRPCPAPSITTLVVLVFRHSTFCLSDLLRYPLNEDLWVTSPRLCITLLNMSCPDLSYFIWLVLFWLDLSWLGIFWLDLSWLHLFCSYSSSSSFSFSLFFLYKLCLNMSNFWMKKFLLNLKHMGFRCIIQPLKLGNIMPW